MELLNRIIQEKESYIIRLEGETGDMRRELDMLREKLLTFELGNMSANFEKTAATSHNYFSPVSNNTPNYGRQRSQQNLHISNPYKNQTPIGFLSLNNTATANNHNVNNLLYG